MNSPYRTDLVLERRLSARLIDVFIRACLILALAILCYDIFSPFVSLMAWALILAVSLYPAHQMFARRLGGRRRPRGDLAGAARHRPDRRPDHGAGAWPSATRSRASSSASAINSLQVPEPPASVAAWPVVGAKVHALWSQAHSDLPSLVMSLQPYFGDISKKALGAAAAHRRLGAAVPVLLRHRRRHDGLRPVGRGRHPLGLRPDRRQRARRALRPALHLDHPRRRPGRARRGADPGDRRRPAAAVRRHSLRGGAGGDRARPGDRAVAGADRDPAGHRLHLVEPLLRHRRGDHAHRAARALAERSTTS